MAVIGRNREGVTLSHNKMTAAGRYAARFLCTLASFSDRLALNESEPFIMRHVFVLFLFYLGAEN